MYFEQKDVATYYTENMYFEKIYNMKINSNVLHLHTLSEKKTLKNLRQLKNQAWEYFLSILSVCF